MSGPRRRGGPNRERDRDTVLPGVRAVEALLDHQPERVRAVRFAGDAKGARGRVVEKARRRGITVEQVTDKELTRRVPDVRHQGVAAWVEPARYQPWEALLERPDPLLVAVDQVTDPRNLGAILRAAEGMGGTGALLTSNRCARLGPTVTRTSAGASELLPVAMETNLGRALVAAREAGCRVVGADLDGRPPEEVDLTGPVVLVIGAEGKGLRRLTRERCDDIATIPLTGLTESLNAATAAAILLYEATRQRRVSDPSK